MSKLTGRKMQEKEQKIKKHRKKEHSKCLSQLLLTLVLFLSVVSPNQYLTDFNSGEKPLDFDCSKKSSFYKVDLGNGGVGPIVFQIKHPLSTKTFIKIPCSASDGLFREYYPEYNCYQAPKNDFNHILIVVLQIRASNPGNSTVSCKVLRIITSADQEPCQPGNKPFTDFVSFR